MRKARVTGVNGEAIGAETAIGTTIAEETGTVTMTADETETVTMTAEETEIATVTEIENVAMRKKKNGGNAEEKRRG